MASKKLREHVRPTVSCEEAWAVRTAECSDQSRNVFPTSSLQAAERAPPLCAFA